MLGQCHPSVITDSFITYVCHGYNSPGNCLESRNSLDCFLTSFWPAHHRPKQGRPKPHRLNCNFKLLTSKYGGTAGCGSVSPLQKPEASWNMRAREVVFLVFLSVQKKWLPNFKFHTCPSHCKLIPSFWMEPCYLTSSFSPSDTCLPPSPFTLLSFTNTSLHLLFLTYLFLSHSHYCTLFTLLSSPLWYPGTHWSSLGLKESDEEREKKEESDSV